MKYDNGVLCMVWLSACYNRYHSYIEVWYNTILSYLSSFFVASANLWGVGRGPHCFSLLCAENKEGKK